jgi:hypothetical protein
VRPQHTIKDVVARLDRAIQYSAAVVIDGKGRSVLDRPLSRAMTRFYVAAAGRGDEVWLE